MSVHPRSRAALDPQVLFAGLEAAIPDAAVLVFASAAATPPVLSPTTFRVEVARWLSDTGGRRRRLGRLGLLPRWPTVFDSPTTCSTVSKRMNLRMTVRPSPAA